MSSSHGTTPGSSGSSGSEWSPSPLPPIDSAEPTFDGPDRLMGPPVAPKLPSISRGRTSEHHSMSSDD